MHLSLVRHHRSVDLTCTTWRGQASERRLDPYGLVFHAGKWYVTGHDHARESVRTFRLDRIAEVTMSTATFEVPAGFDPTERVLAGLASVPYKHEISVVLHTGLDEVRQRISPSVGSLTETADGVRLVARAERLDGAARMLAGLG